MRAYDASPFSIAVEGRSLRLRITTKVRQPVDPAWVLRVLVDDIECRLCGVKFDLCIEQVVRANVPLPDVPETGAVCWVRSNLCHQLRVTRVARRLVKTGTNPLVLHVGWELTYEHGGPIDDLEPAPTTHWVEDLDTLLS